MGRPDALDRVAQVLVLIAALAALANGLFMLIWPLDWYQSVPNVPLTGPFNPHFVRDIGAAYLATAMMLGWAVGDLRGRWLGVVTGGLWLALHGGIHIYEVSVGICGTGVFLADAPGVLGPPVLVMTALGVLFGRQRIVPQGLPRAIVVPAIKRLGDGAYIDEIAAAPGHALDRYLGFVSATAHRHAAPIALFHATRIGAIMAEDCGGCTMVCATAALDDGLDRAIVNLMLGGGEGLPADAAMAFNFGRAIAIQSADAAPLGEAIEAGHGRIVRLELAMAAALVRGYPGLKRGLGLLQHCAVTRLQV
ncbi:hypothetical protein [Sphingomonas sp. 28-62-20]|uniref:hypothetical protein n=1 Tax=Sphingomonas sp. 28-62-20 TaxID=1970433 RepID=UPI0026BDCE6B